MVNEHVIVFQKTIPVSMTVANATGIEKGAALKLADPFTVSLSSAVNDIVGGIAYSEKIASDGSTLLGVLRGPGDILKAIASGSIAVGQAISLVGDGNWVKALAGAVASGSSTILGSSMETATNGESCLYELNIQNIPLS